MKRPGASVLGLLLSLGLAACMASPAQPPTAAVPSEPAPHDSRSPQVGTVDYTCTTDADCRIKDIGNCCGYYPACVNADSPTFPEQVKADCAARGLSGICGFPELSGCQCIEGRCEGRNGPGPGGRDIR